jgi:hypothetical protein
MLISVRMLECRGQGDVDGARSRNLVEFALELFVR